MTFGNSYHVGLSPNYIQGLRHAEIYKENQNSLEFGWDDLDEEMMTLPLEQDAFIFEQVNEPQSWREVDLSEPFGP